MPTAGDEILVEDFTTPVKDEQSTSGTTGSTSYTATLTGGTACGVSFVAPTSGRVMVLNASAMVNSGANFSYCGFVLRTGSTVGSGTTITGAVEDNSVYISGTNEFRASDSYEIGGLTAGSSYNVQQAFKVNGGTGTFRRKRIIVVPIQ